jgi:hypothetical protein
VDYTDRQIRFAVTLVALRNMGLNEDRLTSWLIEWFGAMSHDEIAAVLQLSRQRVSQIEESALSKVRRRGLSLREFADA